MKISSICGCISYKVLTVAYPYTHPTRTHNVDMLDIQKHESSCEKALSIKDDIASQQSLDGPYPCD